MPPKDAKKKGRGRRANYAPTVDQVGTRRYLPLGWANWLGFAVFGLLTLAVVVDLVGAVADGRGNDPFVAAIMAALLGWMTFLFGTNRLKD